MGKCPSCGAELPEPSHFGLKASPKNYVAPPIPLKPGKKYLRRFSILYYPPREDLDDCVVIASEEYAKVDKPYPFISGAKFYRDELDMLQRAAEDIMLAELAFRSLGAGRRPETLLFSRLQSLYHSPRQRAELSHRLETIYKAMLVCREVTAREEAGVVAGD